MAVEAHKLIADKCKYPLHVGITESGTLLSGTIKSSVGFRNYSFSEGIGNTIRVSLTDEPENEILVAKYILNSLGLKKDMVEIISCPTCGRTKIDIIGLAKAG